MDRLRQDLRYALRNLARSPGFTAVAVITLALGIGANSAIFSAFDAVLLTSLPYAEPERLVRVLEATAWSGNTPLSAAEIRLLEENGKSLESIAAFDRVAFDVAGGERPERLSGARVSASYFPMLGVEPHLGRLFVADEAAPGRADVALLSYGLWQRRFGGDRDILGRRLTLHWNASFGPARKLGATFTVVGVLPPATSTPTGRSTSGCPSSTTPRTARATTTTSSPSPGWPPASASRTRWPN
jgi:putative ABC transport system permease protein